MTDDFAKIPNLVRLKAQLNSLKEAHLTTLDQYKKADLAGEIAVIEAKIAVLETSKKQENGTLNIKRQDLRRRIADKGKEHPIPLNKNKSIQLEIPSTLSSIFSEEFNLNISEFNNMLSMARSATDANERGRLLEKLAVLLFNSCGRIFMVSSGGIRTSTHQIDLTILVQENIFVSDFGRFIIVECKNIKGKISPGIIDKLNANILSSRLKTGIIISMNGVTKDANQAILDYYKRFNTIIIAIDGNDLDKIGNGINFLEILWTRYFEGIFSVSRRK